MLAPHTIVTSCARAAVPALVVTSALALVVTSALALALSLGTASPLERRTLTITIGGGSRPELVAYRSETTPVWTVLAPTSSGYTIRELPARYTLAVACPRYADTDQVELYHLSAYDLSALELTCRHDSRARTRVPVTFVDPAEQLWVASEHASVAHDGRGNIVDRNAEVLLAEGLHDWIVMTGNKPTRISLVHDVAVSTRRRLADVRDGHFVDQMEVDAPGAHTTSVSFRSKNGTDFSGLGEPLPGTHNIVPRALRAPGDADIVHADRYANGYDISVVAATTRAPTRVSLALPTHTPAAERSGRDVRWSNAGTPHLVRLHYYDDDKVWEVYASARWLDGRSDYSLVDTRSIPGWRFSPPDEAVYIAWLWSSDPRTLPFDYLSAPNGVAVSRVGISLDSHADRGSR